METINCNLCGQDNSEILFRLPDWQLERMDVWTNLVRCKNCGLVYQNPRPNLQEMGSHYPDQYEWHQAELDPYHLKGIARLAAIYGYQKRARLVTGLKKVGRLLDVGCATGAFLQTIRSHPGWEAYGVETNPRAAEIARGKGLDVFTGTLEESNYPDNFFDVVTLFHVLEHLHNPAKSLSEIRRILKPGGLTVLIVPNLQSWDRSLFGKYWSGFDAPRHLYAFSPQTLRGLVEASGMQVIHEGCSFSGFPAVLISMKFLMLGEKKPGWMRRMALSILRSIPVRMLLFPVVTLLNLNLRGSVLDMIAQNPEVVGGEKYA